MNVVDWEALGWIVNSPDLPENFRELPWHELPEARLTPQERKLRVIDPDGHFVGLVVAIDTKAKTAYRVPLMSADATRGEILAAQAEVEDHGQQLTAVMAEWARDRCLVEVEYDRLEWLNEGACGRNQPRVV